MVTGPELASTAKRFAADGSSLSVEANLAVAVDGTELAVSTPEDRIRVQCGSVRAVLSLYRSEGSRARELSALLAALGLTAELRVGGAVVAVAGAEATPGRLSRRVFGPNVEARATALLAAALRLK